MNPIYIKHSDEEDSLTHYGVKGMKWRKRKKKAEPATGNSGYSMYYYDERGNKRRVTNMGISAARTRLHRASGKVSNTIKETRAQRVNEAGYKMSHLKDKMKLETFNKTNKANRRIKKVATTPIRATKKAIGKGKTLVNKTLKKKKNDKKKVIPEKTIKEKVIPEKKIKEKVIPEKKIKEKRH